ncbi:uncharacterized protein TM35_000471710 [Trypanosoma theileri]|uniref:Mucin-associated surface protein (MASP) n=1 Tax=Trypanosoma theileri TaxID=67003 RepID=A0A1X0NHW1_9TRYP|nr:uncharacterized protein TM35_000471710 [Trypanosoma theileri]ORC84276.1 hypothetical protein TM35_000471710 [Trypanosoma theileri]
MMAIRHVLCVLTIALSCLCSCVVAADKHKALEAEDPCSSGSPTEDAGKSKCAESSGRGRIDDHVRPDQSQQLVKPHSPVSNTNGDHREEGSVSSGTKDDLAAPGPEEEQVHEDTGSHVKKPSVDAEKSGSLTDGEERRGVESLSPSRTPAPGGKVQTENKEDALGPEGQNVDASPANGRGKGSQTAEERKEEKLEDPPQGELTDNARRTEASPTEVGTTRTEGNNGNQQAEGNGVQSTSETSPAPAEDESTRDTANTPSNDEESTSTTTTTTTLPPELTNNKKGDADSSSSISSSVWVRVPLLIVVTLACILVC